MIRYCFIKDEETGLVQLGAGCSDEYYIEIGMEQREVQQSDINYQWYLAEKCPMKTEEQKFIEAKQAKVQENDAARDTALNAGVVYKDVLFDSDTDQKVNLLATVSMMGDEDTITWFGKDNQPLDCTKEDLLNIGGLITQLHSFCWNKNALIKNEIAEASTYAELDAIEINYELLAVEDINGSNGGEQAS